MLSLSSSTRSRKARKSIAALAVSSAALGALPAAQAASPTQPFVAVGDRQFQTKGLMQVSHNFGITVYGLKDQIEHDFVLRNATKSTVYIDKMTSSCACTVINELDPPPGNAVAPGKTVKIHVGLIESQLPNDNLDKVAWLFIKGDSKPAATFHMAGLLTPAMRYNPAMIDFKTVGADAVKTVPLTVTMDTRLYSPSTPDLLAGPPNIMSIKRVGSHYDKAANKLVRTYRVTLAPHGHLGRFDGSVYLPKKAYRGGGAVFCTGNVVGGLVADPYAVAFGTVNRGTTVTKQIELKGATADALAGLKIGSDTHALHARLVRKTSGSRPTAVVSVSVSPSTTGALLSNVIVTTRTQVLKVLVSAWVQ